MHKISAVELFCYDKFEETPKQKVINMSKLDKFHFSRRLTTEIGPLMNYALITLVWDSILSRTNMHFLESCCASSAEKSPYMAMRILGPTIVVTRYPDNKQYQKVYFINFIL